MRNLVLILLAFLAVFTYIRAYERVEPISEVETSCVISNEITVEIIH